MPNERSVVETRLGHVHFRLLDKRSSAPLAGAQATCVWRDQRVVRVKADSRGTFETELPEGVYDFIISANGYLSLLLRGIGVLAGYRQEIIRGLIPGEAHGEEPSDGPATAIAGYVTDRLGRPLQNIIVHAQEDEEETTEIKTFTAREGATYTTRTDPGGAYVIHGVPPGNYEIHYRIMDRGIYREKVEVTSVHNLIRLDAKLQNLNY